MERPAPGKWISGRIVTLLSHYFVAQTDQRVVEAMATDWVETLRKYPAWAIHNACRWWISAENEWRHRKPLPGDIEDRCKIELAPVRAAKIMTALGPTPDPEPIRQIAPEDVERRKAVAEEIMRTFANARRVTIYGSSDMPRDYDGQN